MTNFQCIVFLWLVFAPIFHSFFTSKSYTQSNFALKALKFDPSNFIEVSIAKPFGMSLEVII
jgi:hypothetical protein